ncbi:hypothetical protein [Corallococcus llansteffanensis]|uniref:Uncharacterized protein n=1 Tax=Corallococcus llansteffanensis TaxID=2316731 RepID=A0A3A8PW97_9BACT|nr:hypothetical protein [Corallococcus llansteffanensis]RKH56652.1 hypothetical protein D7V93_19780 [Corallococcus llansteffanensis]
MTGASHSQTLSGTVERLLDSGSDRPVLLYRGSCPKCRLLSRLAVLAALGSLRRIPIGSDEADLLYRRHPGTEGQLALFHGDRLATGPGVIPRALLLFLRIWTGRLVSLARPSRSHGNEKKVEKC